MKPFSLYFEPAANSFWRRICSRASRFVFRLFKPFASVPMLFNRPRLRRAFDYVILYTYIVVPVNYLVIRKSVCMDDRRGRWINKIALQKSAIEWKTMNSGKKKRRFAVRNT